MSRRTQPTPSWPFLLVLACLFVLTVTAPRGWEAVARRAPVGELRPRQPLRTHTHLTRPRTVAVSRPKAVIVRPVTPKLVVPKPAPAKPATPALVAAPTPVVAGEPRPTPTPLIAASVPRTTPTLAKPLMPSWTYGAIEPLPQQPSESSSRPGPVLMQPYPRVARQAFIPAAPEAVEAPLPAAASPAAGDPACTPPQQVVVVHAEPPVALNAGATSVALLPTKPSAVPDLTPAKVEPPAPEKVARVEIERPADAGQHWWPLPESLIAQLEPLRWTTECGAWAMDVRSLVFDLARIDDPSSPAALSILAELQALARPEHVAVAGIADRSLQTEIRLTQFALSRRLDVWSHVPHFSFGELAASSPDPDRLALCLADVDATVANTPSGNDWRQFLLIDTLKELAAGRAAMEPDERRELARSVLGRLEHARLSKAQQKFIQNSPVARLTSELRHWAGEPIDPRQMVYHLEQFEDTRLSSHARLVAMHAQRVALSNGETERELSRALESHYRNANLRITLSQDLMNRLIPAQQPRSMRVNDNFMGLPTRGWSTTTSKVQIRFIPDPHRLRWALEAEGAITSETDTTSGPVMLRTHSDSNFVASKELEFTLDGLRASPVEVEASTRPRLRWVRSAFDHVPLLRGIVHDIAKSRNEESKPEANREARRKISKEVTEQIDQETATRLNTANDRWRERLMLPLENLGIRPMLIESQTLPDHVVMRMRVAGDFQLAGHAPRPRAPQESLASVQVHQSLLTNICEQFKLEGRTFTLPELQADILGKFNLPNVEIDNEHHDLAITFAAENAIQLRCEEGRVEVTLCISRLQKGNQGWNDFVIKAFYRPDLEAPRGLLVRDGTVRLAGDRLGPKAQIALRGIFSKVFPANKGVPILPDQMAENPKLANIHVTQFEIHNGWVAVAVGDAGPIARRD